MSKPALHPWLSTPEALKAAHRAVKVPEYKMSSAAKVVGPDELLSEALSILTECALPPRERGNLSCAQCGKCLENVRAGAKFCSRQCKHRDTVQRSRADRKEALPTPPKGHIGSMWTWPEDEMQAYAVREVGLALCNYLRSRVGRLETPSTPALENINNSPSQVRQSITPVTHQPCDTEDPESLRSVLEDYLVNHGLEFSDADSTDDLVEAVQHLRSAQAFRAMVRQGQELGFRDLPDVAA